MQQCITIAYNLHQSASMMLLDSEHSIIRTQLFEAFALLPPSALRVENPTDIYEHIAVQRIGGDQGVSQSMAIAGVVLPYMPQYQTHLAATHDCKAPPTSAAATTFNIAIVLDSDIKSSCVARQTCTTAQIERFSIEARQRIEHIAEAVHQCGCDIVCS
jgi:hypothetical protein